MARRECTEPGCTAHSARGSYCGEHGALYYRAVKPLVTGKTGWGYSGDAGMAPAGAIQSDDCDALRAHIKARSRAPKA